MKQSLREGRMQLWGWDEIASETSGCLYIFVPQLCAWRLMFAIKHLCLSGSSSPLRTSNFSWFETSLLRLVYLLPRLQKIHQCTPQRKNQPRRRSLAVTSQWGSKVYSEPVSILEVQQQLVSRHWPVRKSALINKRPWRASLQGWTDNKKLFLNEYRGQLEAEHRNRSTCVIIFVI